MLIFQCSDLSIAPAKTNNHSESRASLALNLLNQFSFEGRSSMGRFSNTSETAFSHPRDVVWDFATNPNNWGRTYKGSGGMNHEVEVPIKHGTHVAAPKHDELALTGNRPSMDREGGLATEYIFVHMDGYHR